MAGKLCARKMLIGAAVMSWSLVLLFAAGAVAAEISCFRQEKKLVFSIPYSQVPEINALFNDRGDRVELVLPTSGLLAEPGTVAFDDEWVRAYGLERSAGRVRWFLQKRDPGLQIKSFLALEPADKGLRISLLKAYRRYQPTPVATAGAGSDDKMERLRRLLDKPETVGPEEEQAVPSSASPPSPLASALRSFLVLIFLSLVIATLVYLLKQWRRRRFGSGAGLLKVLASEAVTPKHRVMLIDLLGEILVVGVAGEQMSLLTRITDPERIEELRLLRNQEAGSGGGFAGYLRGFIERPLPGKGDPVSDANVDMADTPSAAKLSQASRLEQEEPLPDSYSDVLSQIKTRLRDQTRGE